MDVPTGDNWLLVAGILILAAGFGFLFRYVWGRIIRRPEEVLAAAGKADDLIAADVKTLHGRVDNIGAEISDARSTARVKAVALRNAELRIDGLERDVRGLAAAVNENRFDIQQVQHVVGVLQDKVGWEATPLPNKALRRERVRVGPPPIPMPPSDDDEEEGGS